MPEIGRTNQVLAHRIIDAVYKNLDGRSGFDAWIADIDGYAFKDMIESLEDTVESELNKWQNEEQ